MAVAFIHRMPLTPSTRLGHARSMQKILNLGGMDSIPLKLFAKALQAKEALKPIRQMTPITPWQLHKLRLPIKKGGLGLTACHETRTAAYHNSRFMVFEGKNSSSAQTSSSGNENATNIPSDEESTTASIMHQKKIRTPFEGSGDRTDNRGNLIQRKFRLAYIECAVCTCVPLRTIMARFGAAHPKLPKNVQRSGCQTVCDSKSILTHISG